MTDGSLYVVNYFGGIIHKITGPREIGVAVPSLAGGLLAFLALTLTAVGLRGLVAGERRVRCTEPTSSAEPRP
jgi:hypothetical protein